MNGASVKKRKAEVGALGDTAAVCMTGKKVYVVDREGLETWRQHLEMAAAGVVDESANVLPIFEPLLEAYTRCDCPEDSDRVGRPLPQRLLDLMDGKKVDGGNYVYNPYVGEGEGEGYLKKCELVLEDEYVALVQSLEAHDALRDLDENKKSALPVVNSAELVESANGREWEWETPICSTCTQGLNDLIMEKRKVFMDRAIRIVQIPTTHSVPGVVKR